MLQIIPIKSLDDYLTMHYIYWWPRTCTPCNFPSCKCLQFCYVGTLSPNSSVLYMKLQEIQIRLDHWWYGRGSAIPKTGTRSNIIHAHFFKLTEKKLVSRDSLFKNCSNWLNTSVCMLWTINSEYFLCRK